MMKNRSFFIVAFTLLLTFAFLFFVNFPAFSKSREITVKTKSFTGEIREIPFYSGYIALVVGVSDYDTWPELPNAVKDAKEVAGALEKRGFSVKILRLRFCKG